jgi:hypothetical protein
LEKEHLIIPVHLSGEGTSYPSGAPKWRRNILSFRSTSVEKEHIILQVHGRIICSFSTSVHRKDKMFLLHLGAPEG